MKISAIATGTILLAALSLGAFADMLDLAPPRADVLIPGGIDRAGAGPQLSLDDIQTFVSNAPAQAVGGSIPDSDGVAPNATAASSGDSVYLYSRFGENYVDNGGFKGAFVGNQEDVIPEPGTLVLIIIGLAGVFYVKKRTTV
jgi:hypothetical protein